MNLRLMISVKRRSELTESILLTICGTMTTFRGHNLRLVHRRVASIKQIQVKSNIAVTSVAQGLISMSSSAVCDGKYAV